MKTNTIITIGREFGSAGREIGYKVAEYFGIKLYDKEMSLSTQIWMRVSAELRGFMT